MRVRDVMTTNVHTICATATLKEAAAHLRAHGVSGLPVVDRVGRVVGVVSATDLLRAETDGKPAAGTTVADAMSRHPVAVGPEALLGDAARLMVEHDVSRLPVVSAGRLVGIVGRGDLVGVLVVADEAIEARVRELVAGLCGAAGAVEVAVAAGHVSLEGELARDTADRLVAEVRRVDGVRSVRSRLRLVEVAPASR